MFLLSGVHAFKTLVSLFSPINVLPKFVPLAKPKASISLPTENVKKVEQRKIYDLKAKGAINLAQGITSIPGVEGVSTGISISKPFGTLKYAVGDTSLKF